MESRDFKDAKGTVQVFRDWRGACAHVFNSDRIGDIAFYNGGLLQAYLRRKGYARETITSVREYWFP